MKPWTWRKPDPMSVPLVSNRVFHACDERGGFACRPGAGLGASVEEPNEGAELCGECVAVVRENPGGRP